MKARGEKNAANMVLAYEISVNDEFQMGGAEPRENTVQGQVKKTVEKAFWDILRDQMKNGDDEMVFGIIREIREQILNFLAPNSATRERIKAQLDMELIEQQWIAGTLELKVRIRDLLNPSVAPSVILIRSRRTNVGLFISEKISNRAHSAAQMIDPLVLFQF